jgi:hypothetical protein
MHRVFNIAEAALWVSSGLTLLVVSRKLRGRQRATTYVAAGFLFLFGFSDLIEIYTGAWWRPLWLLVIKAVCVLSLLGCLACYLKSKAR